MSAYRLEAAISAPWFERLLLAEAVEKLQARRQARNNGICIVRRVNLCCLWGWLDEPLLR
jgi:hypothetical protein